MRWIISVLFISGLLPLVAFAQPDSETELIPSIGLLNVLGARPQDFGIEPDLTVLLPRMQANTAAAIELLAGLPQSRAEDGAFILGDPDAPITLIEFADWACPHCQTYHATIMQFIAEEVAAGRAAFEFRIFPTAGGQLTEINGALAVCLDAQIPGAFWTSYLYLYELVAAGLYQSAFELLPTLVGGDGETALDCAVEDQQVAIDSAYGQRNGIGGTPAVLVRYAGAATPVFIEVGGQRFNRGGAPLEVLVQAVAEAQE